MSLLQNSNAISEGGYNIANSLRFQSASSQYLARTPSVAGNTQKWTWSAWVKRGTLSSGYPNLLEAFNSNNFVENVRFYNTDALNMEFYTNGFVYNLITTQVFRDPSAWYHIVIAVDTTQSTASDRIKLYVNGSQVTSFSTASYPAQNTNTYINSNRIHYLGINANNGLNNPFDGYLTEVNFIDGQALTPSSFGETDTLTGQWVAKKYTGTYGTNGFYLPFSNGTSTTTLGYDSSGNSNNWTLNNFSRSAGVSDCWMYDVPSGNGSQVGGTQPNSNYCVGNPLNNLASGNITFSGANLNLTIGVAGQWRTATATLSMPSGKWYWEVTRTNAASASDTMIGIIADSASISGAFYPGQSAIGYAYMADGNKLNSASATAYGATWANGDVIGIAFDADTRQLTFYKNGTSQGVAYTVAAGYSYYPAFGGASSVPSFAMNFGQRAFAYTPPSGFKALCTANLPAATIKKGNTVFDATLYTGNGSTQTITNAAGFSPDIVWIKTRSMPYNNLLHDSVRGALNLLIPNGTDAEQSVADGITSFNSNGFTLGANGSYNQSTRTIVAWQWDAGSSTVTNTNGTISSQVRANPTAGVSVVTYTGNGSSSATVGHGLGIAPKWIIAKERTATGTSGGNWNVYFYNLGTMNLNLTSALGTGGGTNGGLNYNSWTSSTFGFMAGSSSVNNFNNNGSNYVAYCFSEIAGFSKFGSYTGNGSTDGTFVYTGFRPKFVMVKRTDTTGNWRLVDTSRGTFNATQYELYPNLANAEGTATYDILSNGFKNRETSADYNASGGTYIYMAFAENPFANANAR